MVFTQVQTQKILGSAQFGDSGRFMLQVIQDRFGIIWFGVRDAYVIDPITGQSDFVRQSESLSEALNGLDKYQPDPFTGKRPKTGDLVVNFDKSVGLFQSQCDEGWIIKCPITGGKWVADPNSCRVIVNDSYQNWD